MRLECFAVEATGGDENWLEHTKTSFAAIRRRLSTGGPAVLVLPAHLTLTKMVKVPRVAPAQREKIIRFEAEQNIPYALNDVVWDSRVVGETDSELEVLITAAKLDVVEPLCAAAGEAGFEVRMVLPAVLATLAAFRLQPPVASACSLVLNGGVRANTLLLVGTGGLAVRTFSLGARGVAPALSDRDSAVSIPLPEKLLSDPGLPALPLRLAQELTRSLLYFRSKGKTEIPSGIWLDETTARLPGLREHLAARLKLPVEVFAARSAIGYASEALRREVARPDEPLIELIGAAATQLRPGQPVLNLLPPAWVRREKSRRRQFWLMAAAGLVLAALLLPAIHFQRRAAEARQQTAALELRLVPLRVRDQRLRATLQQLAELQRQITPLESLAARRGRWLELLAGLQLQLSQVGDAWLERLQVAPSVAGAPLKLAISGCLLDRTDPLVQTSPESFARARQLLAELLDSPLIAAVEDERFDHSQPGLLRFECVLVTEPQQPL